MNQQALITALQPYYQATAWCVAYSGGLDSHALLHMLQAMDPRPPLRAIHINHQLNPKAGQWQQHVESVCAALNVPCEVKRAAVERRGKGLEEAAREARYKCFSESLRAGEVLMLAHHADDQAETLLLRLMRGAGLRGLSGMPQSRPLGKSCLLRPLLQITREDLQAYARAQGLAHIHDDSNDDMSFDRNYLRKQVMPLLAKRWPGYQHNWGRSAATLAGIGDDLRQQAASDLQSQDLRGEAFGCSLCSQGLQALSQARFFELLQAVCAQYSLPMPPRAQLLEIRSSLLGARADAQPQVQWPGGQARRHAGRLYLLQPLPDVSAGAETEIVLRAGETTACAVAGLAELQLQAKRDARLHLRFRSGGEQLQIPGRPRKRLKHWFQEQNLEPWLRDRTPLLFCGDELVAVGELCCSPADQSPIHSVSIRWAGHGPVKTSVTEH